MGQIYRNPNAAPPVQAQPVPPPPAPVAQAPAIPPQNPQVVYVVQDSAPRTNVAVRFIAVMLGMLFLLVGICFPPLAIFGLVLIIAGCCAR